MMFRVTSNLSFRSSATLLLAALTLATAGCHKKSSGIDPSALGPTAADTTTAAVAPAPTAAMTADPLAIELGQTVVLSWRTTNATSVSIDGIGQVNLNGTQTVSPSNSTNFHLVAKGDGGSTEANVRVTVRAAPAPVVAPSTGADASGANGANGSEADATSDTAFHAAVQDVYFDYDSYELRPDGVAAATQAAAFLVQHPGVNLLIGGYCDERGSAEYNVALGENRANAARTALLNAGIAASRVRVVSYGKEKQFCMDASESCFQENRRAQFSVDR